MARAGASASTLFDESRRMEASATFRSDAPVRQGPGCRRHTPLTQSRNRRPTDGAPSVKSSTSRDEASPRAPGTQDGGDDARQRPEKRGSRPIHPSWMEVARAKGS